MIHLTASGPILMTGSGSRIAGEAPHFWLGLDQRHRRQIFWDIPDSRKAGVFLSTIQNAPFCGFARFNDKYLAAAWCLPLAQNSRAASIHFSFCEKFPERYQIAASFIRQSLELYASLAATIPAHLFSVIKFARELGFQRVARLRKACWLAEKQRHADVILLVMEAR